MKIVNQYIDSKKILEPRVHKGKTEVFDYEVAEEEIEATLGHHLYNERKYQPNRQGMRIRWNRQKSGQIDWWDDKPGGGGRDRWDTFYDKLDGHIRKYIGKPVTDCLGALRKKYKTDPDWKHKCHWVKDWKDVLKYFDGTFECRWRQPELIIDEDGIIRKNPEYKPRPRRYNYTEKESAINRRNYIRAVRARTKRRRYYAPLYDFTLYYYKQRSNGHTVPWFHECVRAGSIEQARVDKYINEHKNELRGRWLKAYELGRDYKEMRQDAWENLEKLL